MNKFNEIIEKLGFCECNDKPCFSYTILMDIFKCESEIEFDNLYVKEAAINLTIQGDNINNHQVRIYNRGELIIWYFSAKATREIARVALNKHVHDAAYIMDILEPDCKRDCAFFVDPKDPKRPLEVGDFVEILSPYPSVTHPNTALISYKGMKGRIVQKTDSGNFMVVCSVTIPAAEFEPKYLRRTEK